MSGSKNGIKYCEDEKQKIIKGLESPVFLVVPEVGLEPTRLAAHDFESRSSANSDTLAQIM